MAVSKYALLESRMAHIEARLDALQSPTPQIKRPLVDVVYGTFADDPDFDKAMELGRKYRESLRPKAKSKKKSQANKRKS